MLGALMPAYTYFDPGWRNQTFMCHACGWDGTVLNMNQSILGERMDHSCPSCGVTLVVVLNPTFKELAEEAKRGVEEAKALAGDSAEVHEQRRLGAPEDLPALDGQGMRFSIDVDAEHGQQYYYLRLGERLIWQEASASDGPGRFEQLEDLLKRRYGDRFHSLTATERARSSFHKDD